MTPQQYCRDKAAPPGSTLRYALLFLTNTQRDDLCALHALRADILATATPLTDPIVARARLQWWRDELERLMDGKAQHPAARAVSAARRRHDLPREQLLELVDGVGMLFDNDGSFATFKDLGLYAYRTSAVLELMSLEILGYADRHSLKCAHELGVALELMRIIADVGHDLRQGRILLPRDDLLRHGIDLRTVATSPPAPAFVALMREQLTRANDYAARAVKLLPDVDRRPLTPALIRIAIAAAVLGEIERSGFDVLRQRIDLPPLRKLWIAWRTRGRVPQRLR